MSTAAKEPVEAQQGAKEPRLRSRRRPYNKKRTETNGEAVENAKERPRRDRPRRDGGFKSIPVSEDLIGKNLVGKIIDLARRFPPSYGFIVIELEGVPKFERPKIYFNMKEFSDDSLVARRGYEVQFTASKDEKGRPCATSITLTPEGKVAADERETRILAAKAEEAKEGGKPDAAPPVRRSRQASQDVAIKLKVTCEGKPEEVEVEAKIFQSIGRLKYSAVEAFGVSMNYSIYCQRTPENPSGVLLSKTILRQMRDGDAIHISPSPEKPEGEEEKA